MLQLERCLKVYPEDPRSDIRLLVGLQGDTSPRPGMLVALRADLLWRRCFGGNKGFGRGLGEVEITSEGESVSSKKHVVSLSYSPPKQTIGLRFKLGLNNLSLCANHKTFPSLALYWKDTVGFLPKMQTASCTSADPVAFGRYSCAPGSTGYALSCFLLGWGCSDHSLGRFQQQKDTERQSVRISRPSLAQFSADFSRSRPEAVGKSRTALLANIGHLRGPMDTDGI